jgi:hypothetical protein
MQVTQSLTTLEGIRLFTPCSQFLDFKLELATAQTIVIH